MQARYTMQLEAEASSVKGDKVAAAWLTLIGTCKLQKKAAFDFFNNFFKKITED